MHTRWVALCLGLWATGAVAQEVPLLFEFDRGYTPAPEAFLLTAYEGGAGPQQYRVALAAPGACLRLDGASAASFCTLVPCPVPGRILTYVVQAVWGTELSDPSNQITCWFPQGVVPCECRAALPPPLPPPPLPAPPPELPPRVTTPPPRPQQSAEGLGLLPLGPLPLLSAIPPIPTTGGA